MLKSWWKPKGNSAPADPEAIRVAKETRRNADRARQDANRAAAAARQSEAAADRAEAAAGIGRRPVRSYSRPSSGSSERWAA